ncbi:hypothetical protein A4S02_08570 [Acetobacter ascendens]|uniref:Uncharacterized protein n=1 Tax=Acetobacter ascendens TaxID=481146 RepID=A0A1D8QWU8_9PROT|nr:hypothetical protein A4S02_08570 [Acetobacter ascendens]
MGPWAACVGLSSRCARIIVPSCLAFAAAKVPRRHTSRVSTSFLTKRAQSPVPHTRASSGTKQEKSTGWPNRVARAVLAARRVFLSLSGLSQFFWPSKRTNRETCQKQAVHLSGRKLSTEFSYTLSPVSVDKSHGSVTLQHSENGGFLRVMAFHAESTQNRLDVAKV